MTRRIPLPIVALCIMLAGGLAVWSQEKKQTNQNSQEQERKVTEKEVPEAALATLKKMAGSATITEFAEEIEHGHKFYEGSWKGPDGHIDVLVTERGDLVEIEETLAADKIPAAVRAAATKQAGADAKIMFERKTMYLYEIHYSKDGKGHETIFTPDARVYHEEQGNENSDEDKENK